MLGSGKLAWAAAAGRKLTHCRTREFPVSRSPARGVDPAAVRLWLSFLTLITVTPGAQKQHLLTSENQSPPKRMPPALSCCRSGMRLSLQQLLAAQRTQPHVTRRAGGVIASALQRSYTTGGGDSIDPRRYDSGLTHLSPDGRTPVMVDVSSKAVTSRTAVARSEVILPHDGESAHISMYASMRHESQTTKSEYADSLPTVANALLGSEWENQLAASVDGYFDARSKKGPIVCVPLPPRPPPSISSTFVFSSHPPHHCHRRRMVVMVVLPLLPLLLLCSSVLHQLLSALLH